MKIHHVTVSRSSVLVEHPEDESVCEDQEQLQQDGSVRVPGRWEVKTVAGGLMWRKVG